MAPRRGVPWALAAAGFVALALGAAHLTRWIASQELPAIGAWHEDVPLLASWSNAQRGVFARTDLAAIGPLAFLKAQADEIWVHPRSINRLLDGESLHPDDRETILAKDYDLSVLMSGICTDTAFLEEHLDAEERDTAIAQCERFEETMIFSYVAMALVGFDWRSSTFPRVQESVDDVSDQIRKILAAETQGYGPGFESLLNAWRLRTGQDAALVTLWSFAVRRAGILDMDDQGAWLARDLENEDGFNDLVKAGPCGTVIESLLDLIQGDPESLVETVTEQADDGEPCVGMMWPAEFNELVLVASPCGDEVASDACRADKAQACEALLVRTVRIVLAGAPLRAAAALAGVTPEDPSRSEWCASIAGRNEIAPALRDYLDTAVFLPPA